MATYGTKAVSAPAGAIIIEPGDNVAAIVNSAPAGATFFFQPGTYHVSLTPKDGQTFIGSQGAVLNGSQQLTGFVKEGAYWSIGGQTQEGLRNATDEPADGAMRAGFPETVFMDDKPLTPVDALSKLGPGKFYFDYAADKIYLGDNPAGHKIEAGKLDRAFEGGADSVTVQNFVIEKYNTPTQYATVQGNDSWVIKDNEVRLNYGVGVDAMSNSKIIGNYVHDNGEMGMGGGGSNLLVEGNEISHNGWWSGIDVFWEGGGTKFTDSQNLIVRNNYSHDNQGFGLWTDINNINTLYEGNIVTNNSGGGINHEISYDAIIRNNVLMGNGYESQGDGWMWGGQIQIQNSRNVEIYGNKIDMTGADGGNGIGLVQQNRGSGTYGPYVTIGNKIHDNIIVSEDGNGKVGGAADYNENGMLNGGNIWSNNHYYMANGDRFWWGDTDGFAEFRSASGETGGQSVSFPNTDSWITTPVTSPSPPSTPVVVQPTPTVPVPVVDHPPPTDDTDMRPNPPVVTQPDDDNVVTTPPPVISPPVVVSPPTVVTPPTQVADNFPRWWNRLDPSLWNPNGDVSNPVRPSPVLDTGDSVTPGRGGLTPWTPEPVVSRPGNTDTSHWYTPDRGTSPLDNFTGTPGRGVVADNIDRLFSNATSVWDGVADRFARHDVSSTNARSALTEIVELDLAGTTRGGSAQTSAQASAADHFNLDGPHDSGHSDAWAQHSHDRIFG